MLKYVELQRLCDGTFFLFLISWPYTRHYIYNKLLLSAYFDAPVIFHRDNHNSPSYQVNPRRGGGAWQIGCDWNPREGYYFTKEVHIAFIILLAILQALLIFWFVMIVRLAVRVIRGSPADDVRSDAEDEEGDEEYEEEEEEEPEIEKDATVHSLSVANGIGNIPDKATTNGTIAYSNGIHKRKAASEE
jgi:very-long-chain ceramide synthase